MRVCVYTIARNEAPQVPGWVDCLQEMRMGDVILVGDTGSEDGTLAALMDRGVNFRRVNVEPFRFDVARNALLAQVPRGVDVCVALDMDERLTPGWRQALEDAWTPGTTRLRYRMIWDWQGSEPGPRCWAGRIHARNGYRWHYPAHESLVPAEGQEREAWTSELEVHHRADWRKPRDYLALLERGVQENPEDGRAAYMLGREYVFRGRPKDAEPQLLRHVAMRRANGEEFRGDSIRLLMGLYWLGGQYERAKGWAYRAVAEAPHERESWMELGKVLRAFREWHGVMHAAEMGEQIQEKVGTRVHNEMAYRDDWIEGFRWEAKLRFEPTKLSLRDNLGRKGK